MGLSLQRGVFIPPGSDRFESGRGLKDPQIGKTGADNLQAHGQPLPGEAGGNGGSRNLGEVEDGAKG